MRPDYGGIKVPKVYKYNIEKSSRTYYIIVLVSIKNLAQTRYFTLQILCLREDIIFNSAYRTGEPNDNFISKN